MLWHKPKQFKSHMQNLILDNTASVDRWHYPIYTKNNKTYSCFRFDPDMNIIPYDHVVKDNIEYIKDNHIEFTIVNTTLDQYIETVIHTIHNAVKGKKCLVADTHGLDCNVIIAVMNYFQVPYDVYSYNGDRNSCPEWYQLIQNAHWGFNQTPYFDNPTHLVTGMYGDEYMLRNPLYVEQHLKIDIIDQFEKYPNCYMYEFFMQEYAKKMNKGYHQDWLQWLLNDYQLWSYGVVDVCNPYKDKNILMQGLSLDQDNILKQLTDRYISKQIILRTDPKRLQNLDKAKNASDDPRLTVYYN